MAAWLPNGPLGPFEGGKRDLRGRNVWTVAGWEAAGFAPVASQAHGSACPGEERARYCFRKRPMGAASNGEGEPGLGTPPGSHEALKGVGSLLHMCSQLLHQPPQLATGRPVLPGNLGTRAHAAGQGSEILTFTLDPMEPGPAARIIMANSLISGREGRRGGSSGSLGQQFKRSPM